MSHASFTPSRIEIMTFLDTTISYFGLLRTVCASDMGMHVSNRRKRRRRYRKTILVFIRFGGKTIHQILVRCQKPRQVPGISTNCVWKARTFVPRPTRLSAALAPDHDDGNGRLSRPVAGSPVSRDWLVHSKAVCHRHRGGPGFAPIPRLFCESGVVRDGGQRW